MEKRGLLIIGIILVIGLTATVFYLNTLVTWKLYGVVTDYDGTPMEGVTIRLEGIGIAEEGLKFEEVKPPTKIITDENGYYEFTNTFWHSMEPGDYRIEALKGVGGGEYVSYRDEIILYGKDQRKDINWVEKKVRDNARSFDIMMRDKLKSLRTEQAPGKLTGVVNPRINISKLGKYYIQVEERIEGDVYKLYFILGAENKAIEEVEPLVINNSRVYIVEEGRPYRYEDTLPPFRGKIFKNCIGLYGVGKHIPKSLCVGDCENAWRITSDVDTIYMSSPSLEEWCVSDEEGGCGDIIFHTYESFTTWFTIQKILPTIDPHTDSVTYEWRGITEVFRQR